jgi:hypothetical protein
MLYSSFGLTAISFEANRRYDIYYPNGTYTGKRLTTTSNSMFLGFNSKGQLVLVIHRGISVFY